MLVVTAVVEVAETGLAVEIIEEAVATVVLVCSVFMV